MVAVPAVLRSLAMKTQMWMLHVRALKLYPTSYRSASSQALDSHYQVSTEPTFIQARVSPGLYDAGQHLNRIMLCDQQDLRFWQFQPQTTSGIESIHAGHAEIEQNQVR